MILYRYEDYYWNGFVQIRLRECQVIKETNCGYWISTVLGSKKWIRKNATRRYAYPTKKEGMISFKARKGRQIEILKAQLERAKAALAIANNLIDNMNNNTITEVKGNDK